MIFFFSRDSGFYGKARGLMRRLFLGAEARAIPEEHPAFFLDELVERRRPTYALWLDERMIAYYYGWNPKTRKSASGASKTEPEFAANLIGHFSGFGSGPATTASQGPVEWDAAFDYFQSVRARLSGEEPPRKEPVKEGENDGSPKKEAVDEGNDALREIEKLLE